MKRNKHISLLIIFMVSGLCVNAQNSDPVKEDPMRTDWANLAGYQVMASLAEMAIQQALKK